MNTVKKSTFNLLFILRKSKLLKNGEAPIFLRITVQGQVADIMVKRSIPVHLWNQKRECSNGKHYKDQELNHYLETVKAKFYQIHRELMMDGKKITASAIRDRYHGRDETTKTLLDVYREHNKKCRALIGIDFTRSTVEKFDTSLARLQEYIKHKCGTDDILLNEVNSQFINDSDFYLKTARKCQHNSSLKHLGTDGAKIFYFLVSAGGFTYDSNTDGT